MTPGGNSSPLRSFSLRSSVILRSTSIWREVISSISSIFSMSRGSLSTSFKRLRLRVANIAGLFTEDGAQQFFFRRQRGFALGRNFSYQNISRTDGRADADDAAFIEVAEEHLADVWNIARDFLGAKLGVAGLDFVFLDVD